MMLKNLLLDIGLVIDNEFLDNYILLVQKNAFNKAEKFLTCRHHIIPKYYYKYNNLPIDNTKNNIVNVNYSTHILLHYYLLNCSANDTYKYFNAEAIKYFIGRVPENEKKLLDVVVNFNDIEAQRRKLFSEKRKGYKLTEETKQKISYSNKLTRKLNNYKYIKKENVETCVPENMIDYYLSMGWELGWVRKLEAWNKEKETPDEIKEKLRLSKLGRISIHYGSELEKHITENELQYYLDLGWKLGRSEKSKNLISKGSIGKSGTFKGKHHTESTKSKIGNSNSKGKYVNKEGIVKHIKEEELERYLNEGWELGNPNVKHSFRWMTDGNNCYMVKLDEIDKYLNDGFTFGRKVKN